MDNNVSKNTCSYKFFKLRFTQEKPTISVKNLLKQYLLPTLDLYRQRSNIKLDLEFIYTTLERKIVLSHSYHRQLSSENKTSRVLSKPQLTPIVYSCPIALSLASYFLLSPQIIAENLVNLLPLINDNTISQSCLKLRIEIIPPGWINFYFDSRSLASWLEQSLIFLETKVAVQSDLSQYAISNNQLRKTPENLFPVQYIHARCCSLLRLGAREKLITLKDNSFGTVTWHLKQPKQISWLDEEQNLWLTQESEYRLLRQLLVVTDSFAMESNNWVKLAFNLSKTVEIFQAECRFLGEVKHKTTSKAIARLGLIALAQYWLQKILREKLNLVAPITL